MIQADLSWLAQTLNTSYSNITSDQLTTPIVNITTDSRAIVKGEVFVALKGPNFDAHNFLTEVADKGAIAAVVERYDDKIALPQIVVADTLKALGQLGAAVARTVNAKTIAITGSVGKTSVKEMCAQILKLEGQVLSTAGNFNNEIGVPLTLLRLEPQHEFAVVELGANHLGEIAYTTQLARPNVAILNNVAEAHLEGFGDLQGVATAKSEIFEGLQENGTAVFNHNADYRQQWIDKLDIQFSQQAGRIVEFSTVETDTENCEQSVTDAERFVATNIKLDNKGCATFDLNYRGQVKSITLDVPGKHNVANALAAATACYQLGVSLETIVTGLAGSLTVKGRVNLHSISDKLLVIDDTYNANVQSVKAAIDLLQSYDAKQVLVLGDMAELGSDAKRLHKEVGQYGVQKLIDKLLSFGVLSQISSAEFEQNGLHFASQAMLIEALIELVEQNQAIENNKPVVILVKGSRSAKMELVVEELISRMQSPLNKPNNKNNNIGNTSC